MKNVVVISSTPRAGGNSWVLANEFARGAKDAGNKIDVVNLGDYNLNYCLGCYACAEGACVHDDGMDKIAQKLIDADVILFATPVYFYSMSGQLKVFIDRLVPYYTDVHADIYLLATQWDGDKDMMDKVFDAIRGCTVDCFENCVEKGVIYGTSLNEIGDAQNNPQVMQQAYDVGKNV